MDEETKTPEQTPQEEPIPAPEKQDPPAPAEQPKQDPPAAPDAPESAQNAPESPGAEEVAALRAQLARANMMSTAAIEAAKLGIEAGQIPYVLRLAELPESGKTEDIATAIQKVIDDVPAFKPTAGGNHPRIRIGAKDPQQTDQNEALAKAFGNKPKN